MLMPMPTYHGALVIHRIFKTQTSVRLQPEYRPEHEPAEPEPEPEHNYVRSDLEVVSHLAHRTAHCTPPLEQTRGDLSCGPCAPDWH